MGSKFGFKTLIFYLYQRVTPGLVLLILGANLAGISRFVISTGNIELSATGIENVNRAGNILMAVVIIFSLLTIVLGIILSFVKYISNTYSIGDYALTLHKGLISKTEVIIPYKQVQSVDINQSIIFRMLGLSTLIILSAGIDERDKGSSGDQIFQIIDIRLAEYLKEELLRRANLIK